MPRRCSGWPPHSTNSDPPSDGHEPQVPCQPVCDRTTQQSLINGRKPGEDPCLERPLRQPHATRSSPPIGDQGSPSGYEEATADLAPGSCASAPARDPREPGHPPRVSRGRRGAGGGHGRGRPTSHPRAAPHPQGGRAPPASGRGVLGTHLPPGVAAQGAVAAVHSGPLCGRQGRDQARPRRADRCRSAPRRHR